MAVDSPYFLISHIFLLMDQVSSRAPEVESEWQGAGTAHKGFEN